MARRTAPRRDGDRPISLVTGASSGIGAALTAGLAAKGHHVLMHSRDEASGARAASAVRAHAPHAKIEPVYADLADPDAVAGLARDILEGADRLDVVLHNAGIYNPERREGPDGTEETFAVNHLAPFRITQCLLPLLEQTAAPGRPTRIITVASHAHHAASFDPDDPQMERGYRGWRQYCNTKLMNLLWTTGLAQRIDPQKVVAHCYHPGIVRTRLARDAPVADPVFQLLGVSPEKGADTGVWLATDPEATTVNGRYFARRRPARRSRASEDQVLVDLLWTLSESHLRA